MWSMTEAVNSVEELRQRLYVWCGRHIACRRAADYYIMRIQNPCYPPAVKITYDMRKFYMMIVMQRGPPPPCDVKALVLDRLRGTPLEKYAPEAAELAELLKKARYITSRVAAAAAVTAVAELRGVKVARHSVAALFGTSYASIKTHIKHAYSIYREVIEKKKTWGHEGR